MASGDPTTISGENNSERWKIVGDLVKDYKNTLIELRLGYHIYIYRNDLKIFKKSKMGKAWKTK